jgi:hypothetical protein
VELNDATFERALSLAKKDGATITNENAEGYFMAALAHEMNMIARMINTAKGQEDAKRISNNMAIRMHKAA